MQILDNELVDNGFWAGSSYTYNDGTAYHSRHGWGYDHGRGDGGLINSKGCGYGSRYGDNSGDGDGCGLGASRHTGSKLGYNRTSGDGDGQGYGHGDPYKPHYEKI